MRPITSIILVVAMLGLSQMVTAQHIRRVNTRNGLSNSEVIYMFQDKERYLWLGTFDGLNKYDGVDVKIFKPNINDQHGLSGNIIRRIIESKDDYLWITTKGGLNKFSRKNNTVEAFFPEFQEDCTIACDSKGNFFILTQLGVLFYYDFEQQEFKKINIPNLEQPKGWIGLRIDASDTFWVITNGAANEYVLLRSQDKLELQWAKALIHPNPISHFYADKGALIFMDSRCDLFTVSHGEKKFIRNILPAVKEYGNISSIIFDGEDIVIGFWLYGAIKLNKVSGYAIEKIPLNCGVLSLLKDEVQDILWIGTDGYGAYAYAKEEYTFKGLNLDELPIKTHRPVRTIITDHLGDMWLGTKGNGIIKIRDYKNATEYNRGNVTHLTSRDGLNNNSIFAFATSRKNNVLWIGNGGSKINYYCYDDKKIHTLKHNGNISFVEVQSILEMPDNTLWVSSKFTLFKIDIHKSGNTIEARNIKSYEFNVKNKQIFNHIYAIYPENDSIMWLAIRGNGAIRFNSQSGDYRPITFDKGGAPTMNDILNVHKDKKGNLWFGSNYGINKLERLQDDSFGTINYNEKDGLPNNAVRGILEDRKGKLWLSSNMGLILFDPDKHTFRTFNQESGLKVVEFSDNAYYKEDKSSRIFFGGVDGVVWIESEEKKTEAHPLPIFFTNLQIQNLEVNINDYSVVKGGKPILQLKHNQNFFNISFSVADFRGGGGKFSYILEGFNKVWMNANFRQAQFTNIQPGRYVLRARYDNSFGDENQVASLEIEILPPWYLNIYAKLIYLLLIISLSISFFFYVKRRVERKRMEIDRRISEKYREEMNENKLRFYTNITHELCTPLTLIHTPSERILNYDGSDTFIKKYAQIIKSNSERLHSLIQEIIDFRRIETGNKVCHIKECNINDVCSEIMAALADVAEENNIDFNLEINSDIIWNSDRSCVNTILNNLVSNAFKYTPVNGLINIKAEIENEELSISVYNTGKGIRTEDIPSIFSYYSVMDNIDQSSIKGISSRNGLGLAISKNMVELLGGTITIESHPGEYAKFIVKLPHLELQKAEPFQTESEQMNSAIVKPVSNISAKDENSQKSPLINHLSKPKVLVVDDNQDILWVLKEILSEDYVVTTANDGNQGMEQYVNDMPDLIITDIMMPNQDGISMIRNIKINPHTMHIPIIIISAKATTANKIDGIESGADAYITKPFDTQYLKTIIKQLIEKHKTLKEYYNSSASAFEYMDGRLISKEDNEFIHSVVRIIDENISNAEYNPEDLADNMGISLRSLYRKFKEIDVVPPKDFIKKQRIEYSAKLLINTTLTIQEIMYAVGFTTRSFFHKEFTKRYNLSPKEYRERGHNKISS